MTPFLRKCSFLLLMSSLCTICFSQQIIQRYDPVKNDRIRVGTGDMDFMPLIARGYTLMLPDENSIKGVLIFLEDSGYDKKNSNAQQLYKHASEKGYAVLSVSSEIPLDFYFTNTSMQSTHKLIQEAFLKYSLPNENIFFLGASLVGHRAMRYIQFITENDCAFLLNIDGIVMVNFTLDWTRKWHQHDRDIRINRINLWEPKFINYMLETYLEGTPKTKPDRYHEFSPYSFSDEQNRNIKIYSTYAIRAYVEPAINYRLNTYFRTLYENNLTDVVGFLAELKLAGNDKTELIMFHPEDETGQKKNSKSNWNAVDKDDLMDWILKQPKKTEKSK